MYLDLQFVVQIHYNSLIVEILKEYVLLLVGIKTLVPDSQAFVMSSQRQLHSGR